MDHDPANRCNQKIKKRKKVGEKHLNYQNYGNMYKPQ